MIFMPKSKIAISIDKELLELADLQRGNESRSSYLNRIVRSHYFPEKNIDTSLVTHEELSSQLKTIHDRMKNADIMAQTLRDLEYVVYSYMFGGGDDEPRSILSEEEEKEISFSIREIKHDGLAEVNTIGKNIAPPQHLTRVEIKRIKNDVTSFVGSTLKKYENIKWSRDKEQYMKISRVGASHVAFSKHMHNNGLKYNTKKKAWQK